MQAKSTGFIAYYRVSTDRQGRSGLGLEAQRAAVGRYLAGIGGILLAEHTEVETGRRNDRPELAKALAACRKHKARLVIAKLDRLSRTPGDFVEQVAEAVVDDPAHRTQDHPCRPAGELRDDHRGDLMLVVMGIVARITRLVSLRLRIIMFVSVIFIVRSLVTLAGRTPRHAEQVGEDAGGDGGKDPGNGPEHGHQRVGQRIGQADAVRPSFWGRDQERDRRPRRRPFLAQTGCRRQHAAGAQGQGRLAPTPTGLT
jgi:Resolvase, N terminal domain